MVQKNKDNASERLPDVAKPGRSTPDASARPVIVGHRNMVEDPMVKATAPTLDAKDETDVSETVAVKPGVEGIGPHEAKTIAPPTETVKETEAPAAVSETAPAPAADAAEEKPSEPAKSDTTEGLPEGVTVTDSVPDETAAPADATGETKAKDEAKAAQAKEAEAAQQAAIQKLIEGKQYAVHVGEVKRSRNTRRLVVVLLLVIVVLLLGADLAIDAGLIQTSFKPPIDLIQN